MKVATTHDLTWRVPLDASCHLYTPGTRERRVMDGVPRRVTAELERHDMLLKRRNTYDADGNLRGIDIDELRRRLVELGALL